VASAFWKGLYLVFLLIGLFAFNEILIHQKKKKSNTYISTFRYIYLKRLGENACRLIAVVLSAEFVESCLSWYC
jgi:TctA family transporter